MSRSQARSPRVFISYSHDSPAHCQWVARLASRLRFQGIDAVLDQWNLRPGQDIGAFMEQEIARADRVLVVCTDDYVAKAERQAGGVGYERMIVTAELLRDVGTLKFIPIVRRCQGERKMPTFMGSRKYVDLSSGRFGQRFLALVRELAGEETIQAPLGPVVVDAVVQIKERTPTHPPRTAGAAPKRPRARSATSAPRPARPITSPARPPALPVVNSAPPPARPVPLAPTSLAGSTPEVGEGDLVMSGTVTSYVSGRMIGRRFVSCSECGFDLFELQPGEEPDPTKEYRHPYNCLDDG